MTYVRAVDDRQVVDPRINWNQALTLQAGPRNLTVVFVQGGFHSVQRLVLNAEAGKSYLVRFATKVSRITSTGTCELWIADKDTGRPVTEVVSVESAKITIPVIVPIPR